MGVFRDYAEKYHELGINVIPIDVNKKPPQGFVFRHWLSQKQTDEDIQKLIHTYRDATGIAVICGPVSGICAFDFDYKWDEKRCKLTKQKWQKDHTAIETELNHILTGSPLRKRGQNGWTVFYKNKPHFQTIVADRHGVRLFDFKASGYVVIPPSLHSIVDGKPLYYQWLEGDPMDDFSHLPDLDIGIIEEIKHQYGDKGSSFDTNSRHGRLFMFLLKILKIEKDDQKIIHEMIKKDQAINSSDPKGPYLTDKNYFHTSPEDTVKAWIKRTRIWMRDQKSRKEKIADVDVFDYFFENSVPYGQPKKDILSQKVFYPNPVSKDWVPGIQLIPSIRCYAKAAGLDSNAVQDNFERWEYEKAEKEFLCQIPPHDGFDYLRQHTDVLTDENFTKDELYLIFQHWGYQLFARIFDSNKQNRCIIMKGPQGLGKDEWIKAMVEDFKPYHIELAINRDPTEMISAVQKSYLVHLSEFDQTKTLDVAFIKALITNSTNFYREKYGRVAARYPMHASFISTVNVEDMLRDPSGNRRFIILNLSGIEWSYRRPGIRIISQFKSFFEQGVGQALPKEIEAKIAAISAAFTPDNIDEDVEDYFVARLNDVLSARQLTRLLSTDATPIVAECSKMFGISQTRVFRIVKRYKFKSGDRRFYANKKRFGLDLGDEDTL